MPKLSVIIPTHRRSTILAECIRRLERQTIAQQLEVIVVSDGFDDKTAELFAKNAWQISVHFRQIPKSQQGVARNEGLRLATAPYVLFIGDDIFLDHDACEWHLHTLTTGRSSSFSTERGMHVQDHLPQSDTVAVLGFTTWDPAVGITPVMRWLEQSGWQFGYPALRAYEHAVLPGTLQHRYSYTSHISMPLSVAKNHLFRTDVHLYGWEDIEWGMRLKNSGVQLYYEPHAQALHHHRITLDESLKRMHTLGQSAVEIAQKVPEFDRVPRGWKHVAYRAAALLPTMAGRHRKAFFDGLTSSF